MPLNRDYLGRSFASGRVFEVGREHIRQFAEAIGDTNPVYVDPRAAERYGLRDVVAPPTFLTVVNSAAGGREVMRDEGLGLQRGRVVHGEQRFVHHSPVHPGDRLLLTVTVDDMRAAGANEIMVLRQDVTSADGRDVSSAYFTVISRGTAPKES